MEGYIKKYTNFFKRWKTKYAILNKGVLSFYFKDKSDISSSYSLSNSSIKTKGPNSKTITIILKNNNQIIIKANSIEEKNKWYIAIENAIKINEVNFHEDFFLNTNIRDEDLNFKEKVIKILKSTIFNKNNQFDAILYKLSSSISQMGLQLVEIFSKIGVQETIKNNMNEEENPFFEKFKVLINLNDQMKVK